MCSSNQKHFHYAWDSPTSVRRFPHDGTNTAAHPWICPKKLILAKQCFSREQFGSFMDNYQKILSVTICCVLLSQRQSQRNVGLTVSTTDATFKYVQCKETTSTKDDTASGFVWAYTSRAL